MTESHIRSILKGISWRVVGTIDTIILSFFLTGEIRVALKIGFSEIVTKVLLFYLHERIWIYFLKDKVQNPRISLIKAVTWRVIGTIDTMLLGWFYSRSLTMGIQIGFTEVVTKIVLYYFHERLWGKIPVGTVRKWFRIAADE